MFNRAERRAIQFGNGRKEEFIHITDIDSAKEYFWSLPNLGWHVAGVDDMWNNFEAIAIDYQYDECDIKNEWLN